MPEFVFDGPPATTYPDLRDASGLQVGTVDPGGIRDLDEVPDHMWRAATDDDRTEAERRQDEQAEAETSGDAASGAASPEAPETGPAPYVTGDEPGDEPAPQTGPGEQPS